ncbi:MAG: ROK family transcriptional regulator [Dorea sp.]|nr:ROK family transcriptional regulator [Dorea sp.]
MEEGKHKTKNLGNIYRFIFKERQCSRQQISNHLGLSLPTITQNLNTLIEMNLVHIAGSYQSSGGRKANVFECIPDARYAVGIDITRNHLSIVLINLNLDIIAQKRMRCPFEDSTIYYENMCNELELLLDSHNLDRNKLLGVGISLPVIVESDHKTIWYTAVINISRNVYLHIKSRLQYPFLLFNDASSAGLAESWKYRSSRTSAYISLSSSVGGALMNATELFPGDNYKASEFGHICIVPNGKKCYCGRYGCLDAYCSAKVLSDFTDGNLENFFAELESGNKGYARVFDEYLSYLALAVNTIRMCYDCDIILGGTVGSHLNDYIEEFRQKAIELNPFEKNADYIRCCYYKTAASAVGAGIYFINKFINNL